jgi:hypothetical protein
MVEERAQRVLREKNLQGLDIMQLKDGFGGIRTLHVNGFYAEP